MDEALPTDHPLFRSRAQVDAFRSLRRPGRVDMLNLVRYRPVARYADGTETSGADAYRTYKEGVRPLLLGAGARVVWTGEFECMVNGPEDQRWDEVFVMSYPSLEALLEMSQSAAYAAVAHHRTVALAAYHLLRLNPQLPDAADRSDVEDGLARWVESGLPRH
ncbi:DUF1330 domain-containing protein [Aquibium sp. LZ166]|uniref:DUF1330 domain-containing protein n=1 Tax=Aquibium pacificus TaxID=3153579 RepID=A0ABV3SPG7_9HYPH